MILGYGQHQKFNYERWLSTSLLDDGRWLLRAYWKRIALFTLLGLAAAVAYTRWNPPEFVSRATIRFIPPQVSENYVSTNVAMQVEQRIFAVSQLAHSRLTATQMIEAFNLYPQRRKLYPVADLVPEFQKRLRFYSELPQGTEKAVPSILVSFSDADASKAQRVVQRIVELVYEENRRYRSDQSIGTTDFLDQELKTVSEQIQELEDRLAKLPTPGGEDKEYRNILKVENLHSLERRVTEIEHDNSYVLNERNQRKNAVAELEGQLARRADKGVTRAPALTSQTERLRASLASAEQVYENLRRRYKPNNFDVVSAQETVSRIQAQLAAQTREDAQVEHERELNAIREPLSRVRAELAGYEETLQEHLKEQARLNTEIARLRRQFAVGPSVENERLRAMREYEAAKAQYGELTRRQRQSHMASNMERHGHGETVELVDPPTLPLHVELPTAAMVRSGGSVLGACLGYLLSLFSFLVAPRVRTPSHIQLLGDYPVLVSLPGGTPLFSTAARGLNSLSKTALLVMAAAIIASAGCSGVGGTRSEISAGDAALKAGNLRAAEIRYRKAIQIDARDGDAYAGLARVYLATGEPMRAYDQLIRAGELLPGRVDIAEHVADLTYQIYFADPGRPVAMLRELEVHANQLMKSWPGRPSGFRLAGQVLVERHRRPEAISLMEDALRRLEDGGLRTQLAAIYFQDGQRAKAEEHLRRTIHVSPNYTPAYDLLYLHLMERGEAVDARKLIEDKVHHNHNLESTLQLAAHDDAAGAREHAAELLDKAGRDFARHPETLARIGDFWLNRGDFARARHSYQEGLDHSRGTRGLYAGRLAEILLAEKNPAGAKALVNRELSAHPADLSLRAYRAAFGLDSPSDSEQRKIRAELEAVLVKMPNSPFVRLHLGRAYLLNGDTLRAGELFRGAITLDPNYAPGWLALADVELRAGNSEQAQERLKLLLRRAPNYTPARLLEAQANLAQNKPGEAKQALSALLAADPENVEVMLLLARAEISLGRREAAARLLERSAALRPLDARPILLRARLEVDSGRAANALAHLRAAQRSLGDTVEVSSMLASVALVAGEPNVATTEFERLMKRDGNNLQYRLGYASGLALAGKAEQARQQFEYVQKKAGGDAQPWLLFGAMMSSAGNTAAARAAYEEVLKRDAKNPYALNNLAFLLARGGQELDRALSMAESARHILPRSREINDTLAYVYVRKGMTRNAAATLEQLAANLPASQQKHMRALLEKIQRGDLRAVRAEMEREDAWN